MAEPKICATKHRKQNQNQNKKRKYQNIASAIYVPGMVRDIEEGHIFALLVDAVSRASCPFSSTFCINVQKKLLTPYKVLRES